MVGVFSGGDWPLRLPVAAGARVCSLPLKLPGGLGGEGGWRGVWGGGGVRRAPAKGPPATIQGNLPRTPLNQPPGGLFGGGGWEGRAPGHATPEIAGNVRDLTMIEN